MEEPEEGMIDDEMPARQTMPVASVSNTAKRSRSPGPTDRSRENISPIRSMQFWENLRGSGNGPHKKRSYDVKRSKFESSSSWKTRRSPDTSALSSVSDENTSQYSRSSYEGRRQRTRSRSPRRRSRTPNGRPIRSPDRRRSRRSRSPERRGFTPDRNHNFRRSDDSDLKLSYNSGVPKCRVSPDRRSQVITQQTSFDRRELIGEYQPKIRISRFSMPGQENIQTTEIPAAKKRPSRFSDAPPHQSQSFYDTNPNDDESRTRIVTSFNNGSEYRGSNPWKVSFMIKKEAQKPVSSIENPLWDAREEDDGPVDDSIDGSTETETRGYKAASDAWSSYSRTKMNRKRSSNEFKESTPVGDSGLVCDSGLVRDSTSPPRFSDLGSQSQHSIANISSSTLDGSSTLDSSCDESLPLNERRSEYGRQQSGGYSRFCKFFLCGFCKLGNNCSFSHDCEPLVTKKLELCTHYAESVCNRGDLCPFLHKQFPCRYFFRARSCTFGDRCKFSHDPMTRQLEDALDRYLAFPLPKRMKHEQPSVSTPQSHTNHHPTMSSNSGTTSASPAFFSSPMGMPPPPLGFPPFHGPPPPFPGPPPNFQGPPPGMGFPPGPPPAFPGVPPPWAFPPVMPPRPVPPVSSTQNGTANESSSSTDEKPLPPSVQSAPQQTKLSIGQSRDPRLSNQGDPRSANHSDPRLGNKGDHRLTAKSDPGASQSDSENVIRPVSEFQEKALYKPHVVREILDDAVFIPLSSACVLRDPRKARANDESSIYRDVLIYKPLLPSLPGITNDAPNVICHEETIWRTPEVFTHALRRSHSQFSQNAFKSEVLSPISPVFPTLGDSELKIKDEILQFCDTEAKFTEKQEKVENSPGDSITEETFKSIKDIFKNADPAASPFV